MQEVRVKLKSACDRLEIALLMLFPDGAPRGIFQISHGMAEYKERYLPFMRFLTEQGFVTVIHDHRGHGESVKSAADYGYFYERHAVYITEDLHQVSRYAKKSVQKRCGTDGTLPLILFGHSMGSMVVRSYLKKYDDEIAKLIVSGSPSKNPAAGPAVVLIDLLTAVYGPYHRSRLIQALTFGTFSLRFRGEKQKNSWISSDKAAVEAYNADGRSGFIFTLNGFRNLFLLMCGIYKKRGWQVKNPELPVLFLAGSEDPVIKSRKKWVESMCFLRARGYRRVRGILYTGLRHELINEKNPQKIYADILKFSEE